MSFLHRLETTKCFLNAEKVSEKTNQPTLLPKILKESGANAFDPKAVDLAEMSFSN